MKLEPIYAITNARGEVEEAVDGSLEQTVEKALSVYGRHTPIYFNGDLEQLKKEEKHRGTVQKRRDNPEIGPVSQADAAMENLGPKFWDAWLRRPRTFSLEEVYEAYPDDAKGLKRAQLAHRPHFPATGSVKVLSADYGQVPVGGGLSDEDIVREAIAALDIKDKRGARRSPETVRRHGDTIEIVFKTVGGEMSVHVNTKTGATHTTGIVGTTYDTPAGMSEALLVSNAKTEKAVEGLEGVEPSLSKGLAFLPFTLGKVERDFPLGKGLPMLSAKLGVCIGSSPECRRSCLVYAGQNQAVAYNNVVKGSRLGAFLYEPEAFLRMVIDSTKKHIASSKAAGLQPFFRPNILSDIPWEILFPDYWRVFSNLKVYDYSKIAGRDTAFLGHFEEKAPGSKVGILRYDLTYSFSGDNMPMLEHELDRGRRVAIVFLRGLKHGTKGEKGFRPAEPFPAKIFGKKIIDGDFHDLRPLDPQGTVVGLRFKSLRGALAGQREKQIARAGRFVVRAASHGDVGAYDPSKYVVEVFRTPEGDLISAATPLQENVDGQALYGMAAE